MQRLGCIIKFQSNSGNDDDRNPKTLQTLINDLFAKLLGDKSYISASLSETLFYKRIHLRLYLKKLCQTY
ncbi:MAG: transposase [Paludibacter sp.]